MGNGKRCEKGGTPLTLGICSSWGAGPPPEDMDARCKVHRCERGGGAALTLFRQNAGTPRAGEALVWHATVSFSLSSYSLTSQGNEHTGRSFRIFHVWRAFTRLFDSSYFSFQFSVFGPPPQYFLPNIQKHSRRQDLQNLKTTVIFFLLFFVVVVNNLTSAFSDNRHLCNQP